MKFCARPLLIAKYLCFLLLVSKGFSQIPNQGDTLLTQVNKKLLLAIHVTMDSLGNPAGDTAAIRAGVRSINQYFAPIGVSFDVGEFYFIPNYQYDSMANPIEMGEAGNLYYVPNRINVTAIGVFGGDLAGLCGVAAEGVGITVIASCTGGTGFAHEMGHFLGLPHTFGGHAHYGEEEDEVVISELADGSNCKVAGDKFCDTPADPLGLDTEYEGEYIDDCAFVYDGKDANGDYYNPDLFNIMSYYQPSCGCASHFSNEQLEAMANNVINSVYW